MLLDLRLGVGGEVAEAALELAPDLVDRPGWIFSVVVRIWGKQFLH